ncbi:MAG TPA: DUF29 domain-containing protein [Azospirillum sp.]
MPDGRLHDTDFYAWTQEQAAILRRMASDRINSELDLRFLAEEIEELGGSDLRALESDLARVIEHLLKLRFSPAQDPRRAWRRSVIEHRDRVQATVERSATLARKLPDLLPFAWRRARKLAVAGLEDDGVDGAAVPTDCPFTLAEILDDAWLPEPPTSQS